MPGAIALTLQFSEAWPYRALRRTGLTWVILAIFDRLAIKNSNFYKKDTDSLDITGFVGICIGHFCSILTILA